MKRENYLEYRSHLTQQRNSINLKIRAIDTLLDDTKKVVIKRNPTNSSDQSVLDALTELGESTVSEIALDVAISNGYVSVFNMEEAEKSVKQTLSKLVKTGDVHLNSKGKIKLYSIKP